MNLINTSTLAKHYRTTTGDIEKRLKDAGLSPVKTIVMQSGRRFMVWDQAAAMKAMDDYKASRLELLQSRQALRMELASAPAVPELKTAPSPAPAPQESGGPFAFQTGDVPPDYLEGVVNGILEAIKESQKAVQEEFTDSFTQLVANTGKIDALVEGQAKLEREFVTRGANQTTIMENQRRIMDMMADIVVRMDKLEARIELKRG